MSYERLLEIWSREFDDDASVLVPLVPLSPERQRLLFVGLNPSFSAPAIARLMPQLPSPPERYFAWSNRADFDPGVDGQLHALAKREYAYFGKFHEIAAELDIAWDHQDLFFWRETSQHSFRERILVAGSPAKLTAFGSEQLAISVDIIDEAEPVAVVVANALASDIYLAHADLRWNSSRGCYEHRIGERRVQVFLSSMLTGQRALDRHSLKRLVWQIGQSLD